MPSEGDAMKLLSARFLSIHPTRHGVLVIVGLLAALMLAAPAAAPAIPGGTIVTGTVRDAANGFLPLQGALIDVEFWNTVTMVWDDAGTTLSGADGTYTVPDAWLRGPGTYSISVFPPPGAQYAGHAAQWFFRDWNGTDPVTLDVNLGQAPLIVSGTVTDAVGGGAIQNAEVIVYFDAGVETPWWQTVATVTTAANGYYEVRDTLNRGPGKYRIRVAPPVAPQYEPYVVQNLYRTWNGTDPLTLNVVLGPSVALATGTVRDAVTLDPVPGVNVMAYALVDSGSGPTWTWTGSATTDSSGGYTVKDLVGFGAGDYKFVFSAPDAPEFGAYGTRAHLLSWSGSGVLDLDATLQKVIATGTVTNASGGAPLADATVTAEYREGQLWTSVDETSTDTNGDYSLQDLIGNGSGDYRITLQKPGFGREYCLRSWSATQTLSVDVALQPLAADLHEPDDTQAQAKSILTDGTVQQHTLFAAGDVDYVAFQATAGTLYAIETHDTHGSCDTVLTLFDSSETQLAENDDGGAMGGFSRVEWTASEDATLSARVRHYFADKTGFYGVSVSVLNNPPVASNDSTTCAQGGSVIVPVLENDSDADSDLLSAIKVSDPTNGSAVLNANGTFTYTPAAGWSGTDTFTYKANDGTTDSNVALVTVTVTPAAPAEVQFSGGSSSKVLAKYGATYTLSGTLMSGAAPVVGGRVVLQKSTSSTGTFASTSLTTLTDDSGRFTLPAVKPTDKTWYRAYFEGVDGVYLPRTSVGVYVTPRASVGTPVAPLSMSPSRSYSVYSNLRPRHTAGTSPIRIYKWRYVSGKWKSYGYVKAKAYDYSSYTRCKVSMRLAYRGKWRLRAYHPADSKHAATWSSSYDYVTVR